MIKPYVITLITTAKAVVFVDAENEDDAIDMAYAQISDTKLEFSDWEVEDVDFDTDR